uniref:Putative integrase/recombinase protein n=1 Tax=Chaetosphaeridium globosum TaxID=96477 RepID=Q8M1H2_CHAGL|nr:putative integrase/recombinase protein [Chaetosphaeridium globosum]AAM96636.1 putative integrase/recombinase protein [Chaetosphaeridium globosum]
MKKKRTQPRQPINFEIYQFLMKQKRAKHSSLYVFHRNRIVITILFCTGLRVNELRTITWKMLKQSLKTQYLEVYQSKTDCYRKVILSPKAISLLCSLQKEYTKFFQDRQKWCLGYTSKGSMVDEHIWLKCINNFIKPAANHFNVKLSSHSFRINYITNLLKVMKIERVQQIIGHKSVNTTAKYDRYQPKHEEISQIFDEVMW